ncbi:DUF1016 N-terminal domain-containing protein [Gemmatimonas sp.]|uniref:DUF1016 N-terminal domain-containing protein n=1 Tax=Gemmatimonas sp. TaxID=1962908 RepID=UPI003F718DAB
MTELTQYTDLLSAITTRIRAAQTRAVFAVNAELIALYWQVGQTLHLRQVEEGWGAGGIPRLAADIRNELPEVKGFSERNIYAHARLLPRLSGRPRIYATACGTIGCRRRRQTPIAQGAHIRRGNAVVRRSSHRGGIPSESLSRRTPPTGVFPLIFRGISVILPVHPIRNRKWRLHSG